VTQGTIPAKVKRSENLASDSSTENSDNGVSQRSEAEFFGDQSTEVSADGSS